MYEFFRGIPVHLDNLGNCCLDVNGIGYRLRVSDATRRAIPLDGSVVLLHARLVVREDEHLLFGFYDGAERAAFDLLTAVQGVGPAHAMSVLSTLGVNELRRALLAKDPAILKKVKGVGPKMAERLVLELGDKVERIPTVVEGLEDSGLAAAPVVNDPRHEAHRALVALGFSAREAEQALAQLGADADSETLVRGALGFLRRG
ncbi:MAG: Holliday junction branch migration protein RuvA [Planctomycetota bacterium]|nr:MAG: Holliday junction branch migration protein RuvA [Planctomycetota bacterium]